ncbi:MAG: hypothetical protein D6744_11145, partial [Planctomycetota bacterium]
LRAPGRLYGVLELLIGAYALAIPHLLPLANPLYRAVYQSVSDQPGVLTALRFAIGAVILSIPTFCMGATLPLAVRHVTSSGASVGGAVARLYGVNTLGAVAGVLATGFVLIPTLGLTATTRIAAGANLLVGLLAVFALRGGETSLGEDARGRGRPAAGARFGEDAENTALVALTVSGFAAMVYQIMWTRTLIMAIGSSTYAFTCILAAFILGLALGSLAIARRVDRWPRPLRSLGFVQICAAVAAMLMVPLLGWAPLAAGALVRMFSQSFGMLLVGEFTLVIALLLAPTFLLGAMFPLATRIVARGAADGAAATGRAYLLNTLGTILGALSAGFVLIRSDVLGVQNSIWFASLLLAVMGSFALFVARIESDAAKHTSALRWAAGGIAAVLLLGLISGSWDRTILTSGSFLGGARAQAAMRNQEVLDYVEGVDLTVAVSRDRTNRDLVSLSVNGKTDASTTLGDMPTQLLLGHLGALLDNDGPDACVIGLGGGFTLAALACHPHLRHIDCVEISDDVIRMARTYFSEFTYGVIPPDDVDAATDRRVRLIRADGRNHLLLTDRRYDLIVSQPSNPWIAGVSNLFTREYFALCEQRLKPGGLLVVWVQAYSINPDDFRMIVRTLADVFGYLTLWEPTGGDQMLIAGREPFSASLEDVLRKYDAPAVRADLHRVGANHPGQVLGTFTASDAALRRWSADARVHTDDNAYLEFSAPRDVLADYELEIEQRLHRLQHAPGPDVLRIDGANPRHVEVVKRIERALRARRFRDAASAAEAAGDWLGALTAYVEGYRIDPGNIAITQRYHQLLVEIRDRRPELFEDPRYAPLLTELQGYRGPLLAPLRGGTLDEIRRFNYELGVSAFDGGLYAMAVEYLEAAAALAPDDPQCNSMLALAYSRCDRVDDAIATIERELQRAPQSGLANYLRAQFAAHEGDADTAIRCLHVVLDAGLFSREQLAADPLLSALHDDPRFADLVSPSAPASRPTP